MALARAATGERELLVYTLALMRLPALALGLALVASTANARLARSQEPEASKERASVATAAMPVAPRASRARLLPTFLSLVPGVAVHGLGHWVAGDKKTAKSLAKYELLGLGMAGAAGAFLQATGGTRYANEISIPLLVAGSGLFLNSFFADVYGSANNGSSYTFGPAPDLSASLGYGYIYDPVFAYRNFSVLGAAFAAGDFRIEPQLWTALDANNQRFRSDFRYDLLNNQEGEHLRLQSAFTYHHFGDDGFSTFVGELSLGARVEMRRLGESLAGSFASASYGLGAERTDYLAGEIGGDNHALLLGHFGYGFYLPRSGELEIYYEHRRDTFTSGISPGTRNGSGFLGHVGLKLMQPIHERVSLHAQAEIGSALLLHAGLEISLEKNP